MAELVNYYFLPAGRNAGFVVAFGNWPERILKHRGWTKERLVYQRVATQSEHDWMANCMRFQAYSYPSTEGLLEDEQNALACWPDIFKSLSTALTRMLA